MLENLVKIDTPSPSVDSVTTSEAVIASPEPSPEDKKLEETFKRIAKQESHIKSERAKIDEARKLFEAEKVKAEKYASLEGKDPFEILEHFGITYEKLLEADKNRNTPVDPTVKKALDKVQELESKISTKEEEAVRERRARAEIQIKADIQKVIKDNDFDVIEKLGAEQAVIDYLEEIYSQTQEIPDYKEACQAVMDNIIEQYQKISNSKWLKPKVEESIQQSIPEKKEESKSLTNKMTQSITNQPKIMTEAERFKAALHALSASR